MKIKDIPTIEEEIGNYKVKVEPQGTKWDLDWFDKPIYHLLANISIQRKKDMGIYKRRLTKKGFVKELVDYVDKDDACFFAFDVNIAKYGELKRTYPIRIYFEDRETNSTIVRELKDVLKKIVKIYEPYSKKVRRKYES